MTVDVDVLRRLGLEPGRLTGDVTVVTGAGRLRGAVLGIRTVLPGMLRRGRGVIVNLVSSAGLPFLAPYAATKAALESLTGSLAAELDESAGVSVFSFGPGMVDTPGGHEAWRTMAPLVGLSYEELISQDVNPGVHGLLPATD